jgi:hypothetical protein
MATGNRRAAAPTSDVPPGANTRHVVRGMRWSVNSLRSRLSWHAARTRLGSARGGCHSILGFSDSATESRFVPATRSRALILKDRAGGSCEVCSLPVRCDVAILNRGVRRRPTGLAGRWLVGLAGTGTAARPLTIAARGCRRGALPSPCHATGACIEPWLPGAKGVTLTPDPAGGPRPPDAKQIRSTT